MFSHYSVGNYSIPLQKGKGGKNEKKEMHSSEQREEITTYLTFLSHAVLVCRKGRKTIPRNGTGMLDLLILRRTILTFIPAETFFKNIKRVVDVILQRE